MPPNPLLIFILENTEFFYPSVLLNGFLYKMQEHIFQLNQESFNVEVNHSGLPNLIIKQNGTPIISCAYTINPQNVSKIIVTFDKTPINENEKELLKHLIFLICSPWLNPESLNSPSKAPLYKITRIQKPKAFPLTQDEIKKISSDASSTQLTPLPQESILANQKTNPYFYSSLFTAIIGGTLILGLAIGLSFISFGAAPAFLGMVAGLAFLGGFIATLASPKNGAFLFLPQSKAGKIALGTVFAIGVVALVTLLGLSGAGLLAPAFLLPALPTILATQPLLLGSVIGAATGLFAFGVTAVIRFSEKIGSKNQSVTELENKKDKENLVDFSSKKENPEKSSFFPSSGNSASSSSSSGSSQQNSNSASSSSSSSSSDPKKNSFSSS